MGSPIFDSTFGTGRFMHEEATKSPERQDVRETFMQVLASLVAAVSLLKSGGKAAKKAAPSDKMFDQMILDYERAIEQGRAALAQSDAGPLRCLITGNPCGTDTWGKNSPCKCINCQMWLTQSDAEPVATSFREGGYIEDHLERIAQSDAEPEWDCATQGCKQADMIDGLVGCAAKYRAKIKELKAALAQSDAEPHRDPDDTKVICPNCTHQFRAISVMDQARLAQSSANIVADPNTGSQSDAQPVAWQWQGKATPEFGWAFCRNEEERFYMAQYPSKYNLRPLYTAPPRPDVSGLIEAAEWRIISEALRIAREDGSIDNFATDAEYEALKEKVRTRAADRSGK